MAKQPLMQNLKEQLELAGVRPKRKYGYLVKEDADDRGRPLVPPTGEDDDELDLGDEPPPPPEEADKSQHWEAYRKLQQDLKGHAEGVEACADALGKLQEGNLPSREAGRALKAAKQACEAAKLSVKEAARKVGEFGSSVI